ncbi:MAG: ABC transporter permease [Bacteroidales bacterium]|nr:ABC transporter permease [Bacteroidales bacterium]
MFKNYLVSSFRNLYKRKTYSLINILGLATGIASFLIIYLYIANELSYDKHHQHAKNIYRLVNVYDFEGVGENSASAPFPVAFTLVNDYPGMVKNVVRLFNFQAPRSFVEYEEKKFNERNFFFADSTYFSIFDHTFIKGNPTTALDEIGSVVITQSTARKYFGNEDPIGKTILFETNLHLQVSAVIEDVPEESHFRFDFLGSMSSLRQAFGGKLPQTWVWNPCWTYLLLNEDTDPNTLEEKFPEFIQKYFYDAEKDNVSMYLQPLTDIHLKSKLDYELAPNNNVTSIYILSAIAVFLLIIAIINYMNLATATSTGRTKEIGIKKVSGANRFQLILQFIGESIILTFIALIFALILIEFVMPVFNNLTGENISFNDLVQWQNIVLVMALCLVIGFLSGIYPAFYLSSFKPIQVLTSKVKHGTKSGIARKVLVVTQFAISITLIIGTIIIREQLEFMRNADLGFNKENIVILPINRTPVARSYESFKKELLQNPNIVSITVMDDIFGAAHNTHEFRPEGFPEDQWQFYPALVVQYDFLKTFDLKLIAGRDYNEANKTDPEKGILINEAMVKHMGWENPQAALGKKFSSLQGEERVIGVFNDFHQTSLHESSGPFVLNMKETPGAILWFMKYLAVKVENGGNENALAYIEKKWNEIAPDRPFEYFYLEDELAALYKDEENLSKLSFLFTLIIMFIAALGLAGLASFMAEQRTKEIGVRKVLGASTLSIIRKLSMEFVWLILMASVFAWVMAYLIMSDWLNHFPYQTNLNWLIFALSSVLALFMALVISSIRGWIASQSDPVETLKYE